MVEIIALPLKPVVLAMIRLKSRTISESDVLPSIPIRREMKVIRHQKQKIQVPASVGVIQPRGCKQHCC